MATVERKHRNERDLYSMGKKVVSLVTILVLVLNVIAGGVQTAESHDEYLRSRRQIVRLEQAMRLGAQERLSDKERFLNGKLMSWKWSEINESLWQGTPFLPEMHFFHARPLFDHSPVFQFIRHMPKGGNLHVHFGATADLDWFVSNVTYRPHCYVCRRDGAAHHGTPYFHFFTHPPPSSQPDCPWRPVADERDQYSSPEDYDKDLARNMSLVVADPASTYSSIRAVWRRFEQYFVGVLPAVNYMPVFTSYLWRTMEEALEDNVQYLELRLTVELYDLEGTYSDDATIETLQEVVRTFQQHHPQFIGLKVIIASIKDKTIEQQTDALLRTVRLRNKYPEVVLGFDLIQHEDTAPSLAELLPVVLHPEIQPPNLPMPFFFHAGETVWTELTDLNLVDAVLLNSTRVGHAYSVLRHPWVCENIKRKGIAIEISPLSNQILKLVSDLRNHPGSVLLSRAFPVVIASDDPAVWGAAHLSHDFYVTFMALASTQDDLRLLKKLAINSIQYSGLLPEEKERAMVQWEKSYLQFIDELYDQFTQEETSVNP